MILTVVVTTYEGLVIQRVFLGVLEVSSALILSPTTSLPTHMQSSVSPGFVLITSQWYKKVCFLPLPSAMPVYPIFVQSEQATRLGIWYSSTGIFSAFSGVVNYGLGSAGGSLAAWKYMCAPPSRFPPLSPSIYDHPVLLQVPLRRCMDDSLVPRRPVRRS